LDLSWSYLITKLIFVISLYKYSLTPPIRQLTLSLRIFKEPVEISSEFSLHSRICCQTSLSSSHPHPPPPLVKMPSASADSAAADAAAVEVVSPRDITIIIAFLTCFKSILATESKNLDDEIAGKLPKGLMRQPCSAVRDSHLPGDVSVEDMTQMFDCEKEPNWHDDPYFKVPMTFAELQSGCFGSPIDKFSKNGRQVFEVPTQVKTSAIVMTLPQLIDAIIRGNVTVEPTGNQTPDFAISVDNALIYAPALVSFVSCNPAKPEHPVYSFNPDTDNSVAPAMMKGVVCLKKAYGTVEIDKSYKPTEVTELETRFANRLVMVKIRPPPAATSSE